MEMRHIPPPTVTSGTSVISTLADLVTIAGGLIAIAVAIWQVLLYRQLSENERAMKSKQSEIDAIPAQMQGRTSGSLATQSKLDKLIVAEQAPLKHELELLERDRKFILNRLLFAKK
jgi:hypothetical protein